MITFSDKVVVITGAASGIGRALAVRFATEGARLALIDQDKAGLDETARRCLGASGIDLRVVDVAARDAVEQIALAIVSRFGGVDIVVNNAGVSSAGMIGEIGYDTLRWTMEVNFWGVVHGTMAFLPHLRARPEGHLVNVSSVYGLIGVPAQSAYCASKFAVRGFTEAVRQDLRGTGVAVSLVFPGGVRTAIAANSRLDFNLPAEEIQRMRKAFEAEARTMPEAAANAIVRGIRRKAPRILIGPDAIAIDILARLRPATYDSTLEKRTARFRALLARAADHPND
jgi:short-subunit dehydrogenase